MFFLGILCAGGANPLLMMLTLQLSLYSDDVDPSPPCCTPGRPAVYSFVFSTVTSRVITEFQRNSSFATPKSHPNILKNILEWFASGQTSQKKNPVLSKLEQGSPLVISLGWTQLPTVLQKGARRWMLEHKQNPKKSACVF